MACTCSGQSKCQSEPASPLDRLVAWWTQRRDERRRIAEFDSLSPDEIARIAHESGVASRDLRELAAMPEGLPALLRRRLAALGLEQDIATQSSNLVVADLALTCGRCADKKTCAADLDSDPTDTKWRAYCPNAETLDTIKA